MASARDASYLLLLLFSGKHNYNPHSLPSVLSVTELRSGGRRQSMMSVRGRERRTIGTTSPIQITVRKSASVNNAAFTTLSRAHSYDRSLVRYGSSSLKKLFMHVVFYVTGNTGVRDYVLLACYFVLKGFLDNLTRQEI